MTVHAMTDSSRIVHRRRDDTLRLLIVPVAFLVVWELVGRSMADQTILPRASVVAQALVSSMLSGEVWPHLAVSLRRVATGYGLAVLIGIPLGMLIGAYRLADHLIDPLLQVLRPIPGLALMPLLLVIVGLGDKMIVSIVVYAAVFPIIVNTAAAVRSVDRIYSDVSRTFGVGGLALLREVVLPASMPGIFVGLRTGLTFAWMSIIGAELIGTLRGIGYLITYYQKLFIVDKVVVCMVLIGVIGFALDRILRAIADRVLVWQRGIVTEAR